MPPSLSKSEHEQLRMLNLVHDNPSITGMWKKEPCDRLVDLGLAERREYNGVWLVSITPAGVEEASRLAL